MRSAKILRTGLVPFAWKDSGFGAGSTVESGGLERVIEREWSWRASTRMCSQWQLSCLARTEEPSIGVTGSEQQPQRGASRSGISPSSSRTGDVSRQQSGATTQQTGCPNAVSTFDDNTRARRR